ncbi:hypothetical protein Tco_0768035 [Tanacetum coccineum]
MLCQSLHSDDVEDFWRTQDEWVVSSWKLYPRSSVHVLDLTNGKTVYMFVDYVYPIRATLLERMLRHRLTVPPSYCRDVVVAGSVIQTVQAGLRESYECLASAPLIVLYNFGVSACTARQMVFSSPWLTAKKESGSPLQTALVCNSNPLIAVKTFSNPLYGCDSLPKTVRVFQFTLDSRSEKLDWLLLHQEWKLLLRDVAASVDSAVHRVHAVSFDAAVASLVSAACVAAGYIITKFQQLQTALSLPINENFLVKKEKKYEIWAYEDGVSMYWLLNADHIIERIVPQGNRPKRFGNGKRCKRVWKAVKASLWCGKLLLLPRILLSLELPALAQKLRILGSAALYVTCFSTSGRF